VIHRTTAGRDGLRARPGRGSSAVRAAALVLAAGTLCAACTGADAADAGAGAPSSGHYAVATPQPEVLATPQVSAGGYQLVSAGDPVDVRLPDVELSAQVSGPDVELPTPAPGQPVTAESAAGVLTVTFTAQSGSLDVPASSFLGLDEKRDPIALTPDADQLSVTPGAPVTLHLAGQFASGHTTLTWQPLGSPLITWDFTVEID